MIRKSLRICVTVEYKANLRMYMDRPEAVCVSEAIDLAKQLASCLKEEFDGYGSVHVKRTKVKAVSVKPWRKK